MPTSSIEYIQIIAATSSNAQLGINPGGEYWHAYLQIFTSIWFAALLFLIFQIVFIVVVKVSWRIFFLKRKDV